MDRIGPPMIDRGWWPDLVGDLVPLLFVIALIVFGIWAVRRITEQNRVAADVGPPRPTEPDAALTELRLRYARGDLDRDEYVQRVRDLGGQEPTLVPPSSPDAA